MKDYRAHLEALRKEAAECVLICDQTTVPEKRELFAKLAVHLHKLAAEVERAMAAANDEASGTLAAPGTSRPNLARCWSLEWRNHQN